MVRINRILKNLLLVTLLLLSALLILKILNLTHIYWNADFYSHKTGPNEKFSNNNNYLCANPVFTENEEIAQEYLKSSWDTLMPGFKTCDQDALTYSDKKVVSVNYLGSFQNREQFSIQVNMTELKSRATFTGLDSLKCFIQRFEKKLNHSEGGNCDSCSLQIFEEKQYLSNEFRIFIDKTGFYYLNCLDRETKLFDDVFIVFPQHMSLLLDKRMVYKKYVDDFKHTLNYTRSDPFMYDVNYSDNCYKQAVPVIDKSNVLIIGIDSVSLSHFKRIFPSTFKYLNGGLEDNILFSHLNSVDESTIYNILPMLAGIRKNESVNIYDNIDYMWADTLPFIWNEYENEGYVSAYNEEFPVVGLFQYARHGFRYHPTSLYVRPLWVEFYKIRTHHYPAKCHYKRPLYMHWLDHLETFLEKMSLNTNKNTPYFYYNWMSEYTHNDMAIPPNFDLNLAKFLKRLERKGYLDNTLLIFMTDHGNKMIDYASTESGRHERLLPMVSIKLPKKLKGTSFHQNAVSNKDKIISFFDIYQTLRHYLFMNKYGIESLQAENDPFCKNQFKNNSYTLRNLRGISLFEEIPVNRSCADAQIPDTYCSCFRKENLDESQFLLETQNTFHSAALMALDHIRNLTHNVQSLCVPYNITSVNTFKKLIYDKETVYSGRMILEPGTALFELNFKMKPSLTLSDTPIRLNRYANQSHCVNDRLLRTICFCY